MFNVQETRPNALYAIGIFYFGRGESHPPNFNLSLVTSYSFIRCGWFEIDNQGQMTNDKRCYALVHSTYVQFAAGRLGCECIRGYRSAYGTKML